MAERPVFVPSECGSALVHEVPINFKWHPGMAPSQKKKNILELHSAAHARGLELLLEISSKSEREVGQKLSAFHLKVDLGDRLVPLECAFQGSKVFNNGGPFMDLFDMQPKEAKRDSRLKESGKLTCFKFLGEEFPLSPKTAFYDWLYIRALLPHREWLKRMDKCSGFTDIEFNPAKSINCQARSCALYIALSRRGLLDEATGSFRNFIKLSYAGSI